MKEKYIEITKTEDEIKVVEHATLRIIKEFGEKTYSECRYEIERYIIKKKEKEKEVVVLIGLRIKKLGRQSYYNNIPTIDIHIIVKRVEKNKWRKKYKLCYEISPILISYEYGSDSFTKKVLSNIESPESVYKTLDKIINYYLVNKSKKPSKDLDDIIKKYIVGSIEKYKLCECGTVCWDLIDAYKRFLSI